MTTGRGGKGTRRRGRASVPQHSASSRAKQRSGEIAPGSGAVVRPALETIRGRIDAIDAHLHTLINERAELARQVGLSKHADGHTVDFYRPEREAEVLRLALERNRQERAPLRDEEIVRL